MRVLRHVAMALYCVAIFLALDWAYSGLLHDPGHSPRHPHKVYHHGLVRNFDGWDYWGDTRYPLRTNSLGFRDAGVREVALKPTTRRVVLIGDSFTEGTGVRFEDSFAGRLWQAGGEARPATEFLDAGVISYSPTLYFKKIKFFLEQGLRFDELVVFSDISDVRDEAGKYFCQDDDPAYRKYCTGSEAQLFEHYCTDPSCRENEPFASPDWGAYLTRHFVITDTLRVLVKFRIQALLGNQKRKMLAPTPETAWLFPDPDPSEYAPLGVEGGVTRSLSSMQALADILKERGIALKLVVYPWPALIAAAARQNRQVTLWRDFCAGNCREFIDVFPPFLAYAQEHPDWYERLFIFGDFHFSAEGHALMFREVAKHLIP